MLYLYNTIFLGSRYAENLQQSRDISYKKLLKYWQMNYTLLHENIIIRNPS
jgi:hypothetical protein